MFFYIPKSIMKYLNHNELHRLSWFTPTYYKLKLLNFKLHYPECSHSNLVSTRLQTLEINVPIILFRQSELSASAYNTEESLSVNARAWNNGNGYWSLSKLVGACVLPTSFVHEKTKTLQPMCAHTLFSPINTLIIFNQKNTHRNTKYIVFQCI